MSTFPVQDTTKPVVTLFESFGSGAGEVGRELATRLGVPFYDQYYSSAQLEAAEAAAGKQEGFLGHIFKLLGSGGPTVDALTLLPRFGDDDDVIQRNTASLWTLAANGAVILGRNATVVLAGRANSFHVKLNGPEEVRIARAMKLDAITEQQARARLEREDTGRAEMALRLYGWDPRATSGYDMVLNTGSFTQDDCVRLILEARTLKAAPLQD